MKIHWVDKDGKAWWVPYGTICPTIQFGTSCCVKERLSPATSLCDRIPDCTICVANLDNEVVHDYLQQVRLDKSAEESKPVIAVFGGHHRMAFKPERMFRRIRSLQDIVGVKFSGFVVMSYSEDNGNLVECLQQRQPELFKEE